MAKLRDQSPEARPSLSGLPWIRAVLIPGLGVFLIAACLVWNPSHRKSSTQVSLIAPQLRQLLSEPSPGQVLAWAEKLDQPLEQEFQFVVSDAKLAVQSLTANFLPERGL